MGLRLWSCFVGVLAAAIFSSGGTPLTGATRAEEEIRRAEQQMHDAYVQQNVTLFANLYAPDATFTYSNGRTVGKDERVKALTYPFSDLKDEIQKVRLYGDFAIVNDRSDYTAHNSTEHVALQITRVWRRQNGAWQVVAFQSTPIR